LPYSVIPDPGRLGSIRTHPHAPGAWGPGFPEESTHRRQTVALVMAVERCRCFPSSNEVLANYPAVVSHQPTSPHLSPDLNQAGTPITYPASSHASQPNNSHTRSSLHPLLFSRSHYHIAIQAQPRFALLPSRRGALGWRRCFSADTKSSMGS
jgi:hypothetical protein